MSNLVFELERLEGVTVEGAMSAFREWVEDHPARKKGAWGEPLRSVTLQDLALHNLGIPSNGLYVFYRTMGISPTPLYVGKSTSRSFLERIPSHLESRAECWFNTLINRAKMWNNRIENLEDASEYCLSNLSVALIPIDCGDRDPELVKRVSRLERYLRDPAGLNPAWNLCTNLIGGKQLNPKDLLVDDLLYPSSREPARPAV